MSKKHFSILLVVSIVVAAVVFLMPSRTGREASFAPYAFLPALADAVNDVALVRITSRAGEDVITLERGEDGWVVQEFNRYPADWATLKPLLAALSQAQVIEEKTSNPEYYDRLGVEDPLQEGAEGTLVEFPDDENLPAVVVGTRAQGREGQYLRLNSEAKSVLVDRSISLPFDRANWLQRDIVDIPDTDVISVTITHPDGESIHLSRESTDDTDFVLQDIPEGREAKSTWAVNQVASALQGLKLEAVAPLEEVDFSEAVHFKVTSQTGLVVTADVVSDGEHRWLKVEATAGDDAASINERVSGWAYRIPIYKYDAINKRKEDLLAAVEEGESG